MTTSTCETCSLPTADGTRWHSWCVPVGEACRQPIVEYLQFVESLARIERRNAKIFMRLDPYEGVLLTREEADQQLAAKIPPDLRAAIVVEVRRGMSSPMADIVARLKAKGVLVPLRMIRSRS